MECRNCHTNFSAEDVEEIYTYLGNCCNHGNMILHFKRLIPLLRGERIRSIRYKADFTYRVVCANYERICCVGCIDLDCWRDVVHQHGRGTLVVEDVKSRATKTKDYRLKYKLMADKGYLIREV